MKSLSGEVLKKSAAAPNSIAVEYKEKKVSFAELVSRIMCVASFFAEKNVFDEKILILKDKSDEIPSDLLGIIHSGNAFVPVHAQWPEKQLMRILLNTGARYVLSEEKYLDRLSKIATLVGVELCVLVTSYSSDLSYTNSLHIEKLIYRNSTEIEDIPIKYNDICYIYHTSGSTAAAKEIIGSQESVLHFIEWEKNEFISEEKPRVSMLTSLTFDAVLRDIFLPLLSGGTLCIPSEDIVYDNMKLTTFICEKEITHIHMVPSLYREMISVVKLGMMPHLKTILLSGEPVESRDVNKCIEVFGKQVQLVNLYGASETCMIKFFYRLSIEDAARAVIPVGFPIPGASAIIVNQEGYSCAPFEVGEIYVTTDHSTYGYYNNPELNQKNFEKLEGIKAVYRSGDLGYKDENGCLYCQGRKDAMVKIRGMKVNLNEIEEAINSYPGVQMSAVVIKNSSIGEKVIVAYYASFSGDNLNEELYKYLDDLLPYYMMPSRLHLMDSLPRLDNFKLDRKALRDIPDANECVEIRTAKTLNEKKLSSIWSQVLGIRAEKIGVDQDFFRLGGQSIKAARLAYMISEDFGVEMLIWDIFTFRSITAQLSRITEMSRTMGKIKKICHAENKDFYEASEIQKSIYYAENLSESPLYNLPSAFLLLGRIDEEKVRNTLQTILNRHEALRTNLVFDGERIIQKIYNKKVIPFTVKEAEGRTTGELLKGCITKFDLAKDVLFRAWLFRVSNVESILMWDMHHCISDGISEEIIKKEFVELYRGETLNLPEFQYRDFSEWKLRLDKDLVKEKIDTDYWIKELKEGCYNLNIPTDYKRNKERTFSGSNVKRWIKIELYRKLIKLAERENTTLYSILLAAMYITLSIYTGQDDIIIGTVSSGRYESETERVVGPFITTYALRSKVSNCENVFSFIGNLHNKSKEMTAHSNYNFDTLISELHISRTGPRLPLIEVMLILQNMDKADMACEDLQIKPIDVIRGTSKYDFTLNAIQNSDGLLLDIEYSTELFTMKTITKMLDSYETVLFRLVSAAKDCRICDISALNNKREAEILERSNADNKKTAIAPIAAHELFEHRVKIAGNHVAITCNGVKISYEKLNQRANQIAWKLISEGAVKGKIIGIMMKRDIDMIASVLAVLKTGCAYIPIDPAYPQERVWYMILDSNCDMIISDQEINTTLKDALRKKQVKDIIVNKISNHASIQNNPEIRVLHEDLAYIIYTSGSTGKPKGVMLTHGNVVNFIEAMCKEIVFSQERKVLCITTISFDIFVLETLIPLSQGMEVVLAIEDEQLDADKIGALIKTNHVDIVQFTPSRLEMFMENRNARNIFKGVRTYLLGGEPVNESTVKKLRALSADSIEIFNVYGPTETCVWSTIKKLEKDDPITIGKAIGNTRLYILDKQKRLVPDGVRGDLYIGGAGVAKGYLNNPEFTAKRFVSNPFVKGEIMYFTGDVARWNSEGELEFIGRDDNQVKVRGYRVDLSEVEASVLTCPGVHNCACVVKQDEGIQGNYIIAFYSADAIIDKATLITVAKKDLPFYMIPRDFIYLEKMPLTPNGKVDRKTIETFQIEVRNAVDKDIAKQIIFDDSEQKSVWEIWREVLSWTDFGLDDNFFDVGGNSLLLVRTFYKINEMYPEVMRQAEMFANPTIRSIAALISSRIHDNRAIGRKRMPVAGIRVREGFKPFIQIGRICGQQYQAFKDFCETTKLDFVDVMFSIYAYIGAKISGEKKVYIQCLLSDVEAVEIQIDFMEVYTIEDLLKIATNAYKNGIEDMDSYCVLDIITEKREANKIFLSYSCNNNSACRNLEFMNICMNINVEEDAINYRMITNKNIFPTDYSEKIRNAYIETLTKLISNRIAKS